MLTFDVLQFKAVLLGGVGVFCGVEFFEEHVVRAAPDGAIFVESAIDDEFFAGLAVVSDGFD